MAYPRTLHGSTVDYAYTARIARTMAIVRYVLYTPPIVHG
jgi:hypothetical protein